jgi:hypothetical protein
MISPCALLEPNAWINLAFCPNKLIVVGFRAVVPDACDQRSQEAIPEMVRYHGPMRLHVSRRDRQAMPSILPVSTSLRRGSIDLACERA